MAIPILRAARPRLYRCPDDPGFAYPPPRDPVRRRVLANLLADAEAFAGRRPWRRLPEWLDSPHPYHQLYITFYCGIQAGALIEHYAFAWRLTGQERWLRLARRWLLAAAGWEHSDRVEEHFYTANRYMQGLAVGLDLLGERLTAAEEARVTDCLVKIMERWWPEVERDRLSTRAGHHAAVDNGHFGVAAVHLLGRDPRAQGWVEAVIDRCRASLLPAGCDAAGGPIDGPAFWAWENLWLLQFADALRNVTGIDLLAEYPQRLTRPLEWFRCHRASPERVHGAGPRSMWSPALLRLSQEAGDGDLRDAALADPDLGRIYRYQAGVKGSPAECIIASGPYAYLAYDPAFRPRRRRPAPARSRRLPGGRGAVLRAEATARATLVHVVGDHPGLADGYFDTQVYWSGQPLLRTIACAETQPLACGALPAVGGQAQLVARLGSLQRVGGWDRLRAETARLEVEYWLWRGPRPLLLLALRRRPRRIHFAAEGDRACARLDGGTLQYSREPHFDPRAGVLELRFRPREPLAEGAVLFATGVGVNSFALGATAGGLEFAVRSQRGHCASVCVSADRARLTPCQWHEVRASWGGLNDPGGRPFLELRLDGVRRRCAGRARFGELGADAQGLRARSTPRTFYVHPNTALTFGGPVHRLDAAARCDFDRLALRCPGRVPLEPDLAGGLPQETGGGELAWWMHPVEDLGAVGGRRLRLAAGRRRVEVLAVAPASARFAARSVPYAPAGLAAGSLRPLQPTATEPSLRIVAGAGAADHLVLVFAPASARARAEPAAAGFRLRAWGEGLRFEVRRRGRAILAPA